MGWTSYKSSKPFEIEFQGEFSRDGYQILAFNEVAQPSPTQGNDGVERSEIYAAIRHPKGYVFGLVVLFERDAEGMLYYKDMDESVGPNYYEASEEVMNALSKPEEFPNGDISDYAKNWRSECLKQL